MNLSPDVNMNIREKSVIRLSANRVMLGKQFHPFVKLSVLMILNKEVHARNPS